MSATRLTRCLALATAALVAACGQDDPLLTRARGLFQPIDQEPPAIEGLPTSTARVELGRMLYFEPRLSRSHNVSCNTCHLVGLGGVDGDETSIGHGWQRGGRNAPTVLNAVYNTAQFWDGRAADLHEQAGGPIENPIEMAITAEHAVAQLTGIPGYVAKFQEAFPDQATPISFDNVRTAITLFEATLITPNAPFDRYLRGDTGALTAGQQEGLRLFMDRGCVSCHGGRNLGGTSYSPFGLVAAPDPVVRPPEDKGRFAVTRSPNDEYVFRVPSLRNVELTRPYFHSGKVWDLREAVTIMGSSQLGAELTPDEVDRIHDFLLALTGDQPQVVFPVLPPSVAMTPRPEE